MFKKKDEMQFFFNLFDKKCCKYSYNYYIASLNLTSLLKKYGYEKRFKSKDTISPNTIFNYGWL